MQDRPIVFPSASKHGVAEEDALHAYANPISTYHQDDDMIMIIGGGRDGQLLEIGVVRWHGDIAIAHALPARPKYLR